MKNFAGEVKFWEEKLTQEITAFHVKLLKRQEETPEIKNIEKLACHLLTIEDLEKEISDRGYLVALLQQPWEYWKKELVQQEFLSYFEAASNLEPELIQFLFKTATQAKLEDQDTLWVGAVLVGEVAEFIKIAAEKKYHILLTVLHLVSDVTKFMQSLEKNDFLALDSEQIIKLQLEIKAEFALRRFDLVRKENRAMDRALKMFEEKEEQ